MEINCSIHTERSAAQYCATCCTLFALGANRAAKCSAVLRARAVWMGNAARRRAALIMQGTWSMNINYCAHQHGSRQGNPPMSKGGGKITPILFSPAHLWNRERYNGVLLWLFLHMVPLRNAIQTTSETVHVYHSCTHDERVTDVAMCTQYVFRNSSTSTTNTKYILRVHRYISN